MKLTRNEQQEPEAENTLPLINIVFLLLIFFMIAGSLQNRAPFHVDPLAAEGGSGTEIHPLDLFVSAKGELALQGQIISLSELGRHLDALRAEGEQISVIRIKTDKASESLEVIRLLQELKKQKVDTVTLAVVG